MIELPYWLVTVIAAVVASAVIAIAKLFGRQKPQTKPTKPDVELVVTEPDAIEVIDDDPTPTVGPKLSPVDYPDDDPAVVDKLSEWADV